MRERLIVIVSFNAFPDLPQTLLDDVSLLGFKDLDALECNTHPAKTVKDPILVHCVGSVVHLMVSTSSQGINSRLSLFSRWIDSQRSHTGPLCWIHCSPSWMEGGSQAQGTKKFHCIFESGKKCQKLMNPPKWKKFHFFFNEPFPNKAHLITHHCCSLVLTFATEAMTARGSLTRWTMLTSVSWTQGTSPGLRRRIVLITRGLDFPHDIPRWIREAFIKNKHCKASSW